MITLCGICLMFNNIISISDYQMQLEQLVSWLMYTSQTQDRSILATNFLSTSRLVFFFIFVCEDTNMSWK
jgi:hypothetical protein